MLAVKRLGWALATGLAWWTASVPAAGGPAELERAKELFQRGLDDMLAGRYDSGCPTLAESYELSRMPGALFTLAECEAKWGKLARALERYRAYLALYVKLTPEQRRKQAERKGVATEQVDALEGAVPRLTIELPEPVGAGTVVTLDGVEVPPSALGTAQPVDPGSHRLVVTWPDGATRSYEPSLTAGSRRRVVVEPPAGAVGDPGGADPGDDGAGLRIGGYVVGAVGLALVATGAITGGAAIGTKQGIEEHCDGTVCNQEGKDAADTTQLLGNVSTATLVVGGAAVAAAVVLLLVAPDGDDGEARETSGSLRSFRCRPLLGMAPGATPGPMVGVVGRF